MALNLEIKKLKRAGYLPAFLGGALLAAAFPLANMLFRPETFTAMPGRPFDILMDADWQMMAMLNILVSICQILEIDGHVVTIIQIVFDTTGHQDRNQQHCPYYVLPTFHCILFIGRPDERADLLSFCSLFQTACHVQAVISSFIMSS